MKQGTVSHLQPNRWPRPYRRALDQAMQRDRTYFARHPAAQRYEGRIIPGEFGPELPVTPHARILIYKLNATTRTRVLLPTEQTKGGAR